MELVPPNKSEDASGMAAVDWLVLNSAKNVFISSILLFIWGFYGMGIAAINLGRNFCLVEVSTVFTLYGVFSDSLDYIPIGVLYVWEFVCSYDD
jgi:hypothetical protein